jgi:hypothetical protein
VTVRIYYDEIGVKKWEIIIKWKIYLRMSR